MDLIEVVDNPVYVIAISYIDLQPFQDLDGLELVVCYSEKECKEVLERYSEDYRINDYRIKCLKF